MTAYSPVRDHLTLPHRYYEDTTPRGDAEAAECAVEKAVALWVTYDEPDCLEVVRLLTRPDLTPLAFLAFAVTLCDLSLDVEAAGKIAEREALKDDYVRHLAAMSTRPVTT